MSDYIKWIEHKGHKVLFCDFSNFDEQQYLDGTELMEKELLSQEKGSNSPLVIDVTNSHMTKKTSDRGKKTVTVLTDAEITTTTAMVGVTGIKKIIAQAISRDVYFAKDLDSAMDWAISH